MSILCGAPGALGGPGIRSGAGGSFSAWPHLHRRPLVETLDIALKGGFILVVNRVIYEIETLTHSRGDTGSPL